MPRVNQANQANHVNHTNPSKISRDNSAADLMGAPITEIGGLVISSKEQEILCLLDDGRLLVSKSHQFTTDVRTFCARLNRQNITYELIAVDMSVIAKVYASSQAGIASASANGQSASQMQQAATEIFTKAVKARASDIHIRLSKQQKAQIFFRVHGDLALAQEGTEEWGDLLCRTIYQSMADVSDTSFETMSRQDARIADAKKLPTGIDGIRIATAPQVGGYIMVLRLLYNDTTDSVDLIGLGYSAEQAQNIYYMRRNPIGIAIIGGPTGSGKSTTLQYVISAIIQDCDGRKHVITLEDPPEYPILGSVQTPVTNAEGKEGRSAAFQAAIKGNMRLDPDVMMIGEVRDLPSAQLSIEAATTGHNVWTTVHANNAFAILDRFLNFGIAPDLMTDPTIVTGLISQRLLKVLCPSCKTPLRDALGNYDEVARTRILSVGNIETIFVAGKGCDACKNTGVAGRTVVAETVVTDETLMAFIRNQQRAQAIQYWREELHGMTMLEHAIVKIKQGIVDPFQAEDIVGLLSRQVRQMR